VKNIVVYYDIRLDQRISQGLRTTGKNRIKAKVYYVGQS